MMYDNDVGRAVDRYFNRKNRETVAGPSGTSNGQQGNDTINLDDSEVEYMDTNEPPPKKPARVTRTTRQSARRIANGHGSNNIEPMPGSSRSSRSNGDDDVRRPIMPVQGQLVQESFDQTWRPAQSHVPAGIFQSAINPNRLQEMNNIQIEQRRNRTNGRLQTLFQPPVDLTLVAPWEIVCFFYKYILFFIHFIGKDSSNSS